MGPCPAWSFVSICLWTPWQVGSPLARTRNSAIGSDTEGRGNILQLICQLLTYPREVLRQRSTRVTPTVECGKYCDVTYRSRCLEEVSNIAFGSQVATLHGGAATRSVSRDVSYRPQQAITASCPRTSQPPIAGQIPSATCSS
jgi:hypothetical protein